MGLNREEELKRAMEIMACVEKGGYPVCGYQVTDNELELVFRL